MEHYPSCLPLLNVLLSNGIKCCLLNNSLKYFTSDFVHPNQSTERTLILPKDFSSELPFQSICSITTAYLDLSLSLKTLALLTAIKTLLPLPAQPLQPSLPLAPQPPRTSFSVLSAQFFLAQGLSGSLVGTPPHSSPPTSSFRYH